MKDQRSGDVLRHNSSFKVMAHLRLDSPLDGNKEKILLPAEGSPANACTLTTEKQKS